MSLEVRPVGSDADYLASLNQCFNGWGGETEFDWYFRRPFGGRTASRFLLEEEGETLAGSAVTWRELAGSDGAERRIGVMTGSWTLPAARGRGCFGKIIEVSRELCVENASAWLLAFVTEDNASRRALERAGSLMIPTSYIWSPETDAQAPSGSADVEVVEGSDERVGRLVERRAEAAAGATAFHYPTAELWRAQMIERPTGTEIVEAGGQLAVIEKHKVFDRLLTSSASADGDDRLALEAALAARALASGRRYFSFTSSRAHAARLREALGLAGVDGFITLLGAAEPAPDAAGAWFVESGDRV